jgi:ring-1,2-phenylacetyl-CoA epoxidase subunit PaaA
MTALADVLFREADEVVVRTPEEFHAMPEDYREVAVRQMRVHTEGELSGADDYIEVFFPLAPNADERQVCCERAVEEFNHYKIGAAVLAGVGVDTTEMESQALTDRGLFASPELHRITTWAERGVFSFLGEDAVMDHLLEMQQSSYRPWAESFASIIRDERVHIGHGARIVRNLLLTDDGRDQVQAAVDRLWPQFIALFGHPASRRSKLAVRWGLRQRTNGEALDAWVGRTVPRLDRLGLTVPA